MGEFAIVDASVLENDKMKITILFVVYFLDIMMRLQRQKECKRL